MKIYFHFIFGTGKESLPVWEWDFAERTNTYYFHERYWERAKTGFVPYFILERSYKTMYLEEHRNLENL